MAFEVIQGFNISKNEGLDSRRTVKNSEAEMLAIKWVHKGLIVTRTDTTPNELWICKVATSTQSGTPNYTDITDWEEFTGTPGINGTNGTIWYNGTGIPNDVLGNNNDYYLDNNTGNYYRKDAGTWGAAQGSLQGPAGTNGLDGAGAARFGSLLVTGAATGQPMTTTPILINQWDADTDFGDITADATTDNDITIGSSGQLLCNLNLDVESSISNRTYIFEVYANNAATGIIGSVVFKNELQRAVSIAIPFSELSTNSVYTLYGYTASSTGTMTISSGDFSISSIGGQGNDGIVGKALIHTEADITLTAAKITAVQSGSYTPQNPWSASVQNDARTSSQQNSTAGIIGNMSKNSISYNGTSWFNNGRWVGLDGSNGNTGAKGDTGDTGPVGPTGTSGANLTFDIRITQSSLYTITSQDPRPHNIIYNVADNISTPFRLPTFPGGIKKVTIHSNTANLLQVTVSAPGEFTGSFLSSATTQSNFSFSNYVENKKGSFDFIPSIAESGRTIWSCVGGVIPKTGTFGSIISRPNSSTTNNLNLTTNINLATVAISASSSRRLVLVAANATLYKNGEAAVDKQIAIIRTDGTYLAHTHYSITDGYTHVSLTGMDIIEANTSVTYYFRNLTNSSSGSSITAADRTLRVSNVTI